MMKAMTAAGLLLGQLGATPPLVAATIDDQPMVARQNIGAFAGARLRLRLGGTTPRLAAGVTFAPVARDVSLDGRVRVRFGEGIGFTSANGGMPTLNLAGRSLGQIRTAWQDRQADEEEAGVPTWALLAGGVVLAVVVAGALYVDAGNDATD